MERNEDRYMRGYREGSADKKEKLIRLVQRYDPIPEWSGREVRNAILRLLEAEK